MALDETHDPGRFSWLASANLPGSDFPLQNLPFGVFRARGEQQRFRCATAIGDSVLDLCGAARAGLLEALDRAQAETLEAPSLKAFAELGPRARRALRRELAHALSSAAPTRLRDALGPHLYAAGEVELALPFEIGDFSDFYSSRHHAQNVGKLFRPDNPLTPNYVWLPIGYHARASSVVLSGAPITRPAGQRKSASSVEFGPSIRLDYEVELGCFIAGGNALAQPIPIAHAPEHIFGLVLLNDWSARDLQAWEGQPLGPFLGKSFATTLSPWVVTLEALEPFRVPATPRQPDDPALLDYLFDATDQAEGQFSIELELWLSSERMRRSGVPPDRLCRSNAREAYWTLAQLVAHQTSNGCNLRTGDLLGTGTLSGSAADSLGSLLELGAGREWSLPNGERRTFLEDGDEVVLRGRAVSAGAAPIGFGEARGRVVPPIAG